MGLLDNDKVVAERRNAFQQYKGKLWLEFAKSLFGGLFILPICWLFYLNMDSNLQNNFWGTLLFFIFLGIVFLGLIFWGLDAFLDLVSNEVLLLEVVLVNKREVRSREQDHRYFLEFRGDNRLKNEYQVPYKVYNQIAEQEAIILHVASKSKNFLGFDKIQNN